MARFTDEQMRAIEAQGRTIVSASAGSGKTTVMIEKIIRLIKSGCNVGDILAVTFTKKAASQMKEKLAKALIETINEAEISEERRASLKKQLNEVPSADISTIHSFCAKLLRTHFYAAGVDNTFRIIGADDAEGTALRNAALDDLLEEGYEEKEEMFSYLLSIYWRKKSDRALRGIFLSAYEELRNRADYREYLQASQSYTEETFDQICIDLKQKLEEKCRYYYELVEDERAFFMDVDEKPQIALCEELMTLLEQVIYAQTYFDARLVTKPKFTVNRVAKKDKDTPEKKLHRERIAFLKDRITKIIDGELAKTLTREEELKNFLQSGKAAEALAVYLLRFDEKYEKLKAERGVLDYADLEHKSLKLLENNEIVAEMREKYRYVFVDEYQDVNPVQEALISRLSGENLFLVGDVKQAIYGFRGSKSGFFVEKQKEFDNGGGKNLYMSRNFRSSDQVLDAVNLQFSLAMTPKVCSVDYARDSRMEKGGRYALNDGRVRIHFFGEEEKTETGKRGVYSVREHAQGRLVEESLVARKIRNIIEEERRSKFFDPDIGEEREVKYSDIAVLSRKKQGQIARTVESLSAEGIPVTAAAAVNICDFSDVKMLIDLLQLIDNAEQDVPLCSVLLSPIGKLTADDLTEIRLAYREERFFRNACKKYAAEQNNLLAHKLKSFYTYYEQIRLNSTVLDAAELLTNVISETRLEAYLLAKPNGMSAMKRIHRFLEEALSPEPLCVHAFLDKLRDLGYKIEYSENGGEDSVKVLTMHSSKGLEYPIVILDNLSAPFRGGDYEEVYVEERYGLAPRAFDSERMLKADTLLRRLHEIKEGESSLADALNLYYVALTRAKYGLHMLFKEETPMPDVKYARSFAEFTDFNVWRTYIEEDHFFNVPKQDRDALVFRPDEALAKQIMDAFLWQYPYKGYENLPVKSSASRLLSQQAETEEENSIFVLGERYEKGSTDKEKGLAYHAFLENFDFDTLGETTKDALTERIELELERMNARGMDEVKYLSKEKLLEILSNPVFISLQGKRLYKEQKFLVSLPIRDTYAKGMESGVGDSNEEIIFQGAIDLLAVGEDGSAQIIDYKYSQGGGEYLASHYAPQLDLYKQAVAKILHLSPEKIRCTIVNIYHGFEVNVEV